MEKNIYQQNGFESRYAYLINLADNFGVSKRSVLTLAAMLGESEDFDGLVTSIEDMADEMGDY
jgi:hypothetical protein